MSGATNPVSATASNPPSVAEAVLVVIDEICLRPPLVQSATCGSFERRAYIHRQLEIDGVNCLPSCPNCNGDCEDPTNFGSADSCGRSIVRVVARARQWLLVFPNTTKSRTTVARGAHTNLYGKRRCYRRDCRTTSTDNTLIPTSTARGRSCTAKCCDILYSSVEGGGECDIMKPQTNSKGRRRSVFGSHSGFSLTPRQPPEPQLNGHTTRLERQ